jgi:hypothetical protein
MRPGELVITATSYFPAIMVIFSVNMFKKVRFGSRNEIAKAFAKTIVGSHFLLKRN